MQKPKESEVLAVYRPSVLNQAKALVWFLPPILFLLIVFRLVENFAVEIKVFIGIVFLLAVCFSLLYDFLVLTRNKLIIREDGVEWWYGRKHDFAAWDDLAQWDRKHYFGGRQRNYCGIYSDDSRFIPIDHYLFIPVFAFPTVSKEQKLRRLRKTEAGELIEYYAPHLFKDLEKQKHS